MSKQFFRTFQGARARLATLVFCSMVVFTAGCGSPGSDDGEVISEIELPTDTLLDLSCPDVGIFAESCVLQDPANPFRTATILEFNVNDPDAETKFALANEIPAGPTGAKARFYFWATALARFPSGENQWYTARALHELWDAAGDPIVQTQALRAYRSVLDNFFGSVTFFECCVGADPNNPDDPIPFPATLNELTADNLYRVESTGWAQLVPGVPLLTLSLIGDWGYTYRPATGPLFTDGLVTVNQF